MSKNGTWRALKILECFEDLEWFRGVIQSVCVALSKEV
jgi:hypothetical protein